MSLTRKDRWVPHSVRFQIVVCSKQRGKDTVVETVEEEKGSWLCKQITQASKPKELSPEFSFYTMHTGT